MYPSLGIGMARNAQYRFSTASVLAECPEGDVISDGTGAALVKLRFDRGTILLADPPNGVNLAAAPGVLWDRRVRAYHLAPCSGRS